MFARIFLCLLPLVAQAANLSDEFIKKEMTDFYNNPNAYYAKPVKKLKPATKKVENFKLKKQIRTQIINSAKPISTKSLPGRNDNVEDLLRGYAVERNIFEIQAKGWNKAQLATQPWSDDYWAIYKGILGARYADDEFTYLAGWKEAFDYIQGNTAADIYQTGDALQINRLSPSEKFDLLIDGKNHIVTKHMWAQGKYYYENSPDGEVETWMGICHGWAPAAYMVERPKKPIEVVAFDNKTKIKFYPADLKALASLLWSSTQFETNFIGGRCNSRDPNEDSDGRLTDLKCLDTNPASFHLSVINAVAGLGKSFVMDVTYDYEVWNQPVSGYSYRYFNPVTRQPTDDPKVAIIPVEQFEQDPYRKFRAKKTKYVVGVSLEVSYGVETTPVHSEFDSQAMDSINTAFYFYDLELDENYNIIGGEWYNRDHPDFLWSPSYNAKALTQADYYLLSRESWDGKSALGDDIRKLAVHASKQGSPLAYIVNSLIKMAQ